MSPACPISKETVDERSTRLGALIVLVPLGLALFLLSPWPALLLVVDFGLRGFGARGLSPVARLARWFASALGLPPKPVNAGPKAFAAKLGFGFSVAVVAALLLGQTPLAWAAGVPFGLCALLEGAFGLCVGCRIYQAWHRLRPVLVARRAPASR
jgi:hypothetical protein